MKTLFITSTRLGDGVLSTGLLNHLAQQYPAMQTTVACGPLVAGIFAPFPTVERVIPLKQEPHWGHWRKLAKEVYGTRWDIVVDLRNSLLSRLLRADKKYIWGKADKSLHKVEQLAQVLGVSPPPSPTLYFDTPTLQQAQAFITEGAPVLAIGPSANWPAKTWPAENFIELIARLTAPQGLMPDWRVAVIAAPGEEKQALPVLESIPAARRIDVIAKASPLLAAAVIKHCAFYIGNDSGLMHSSAAAGVPTLGLFGPSWPHLYRPWGAHTAFVSTPQNFTELTSYEGYEPKTAPCLMRSLTVDSAYAGVEDLFRRRFLNAA